MSLLEFIVTMIFISILAVLAAIGITFVIYTLFWGEINEEGERHDPER